MTNPSIGGHVPDAKAKEVVVLDSSTFIKEIGLTSQTGSALKHYLFCRGTQLVVPEAAAEEYERNLVRVAQGKIDRVQRELRWLAQFFQRIKGWSGPGQDVIEERAKALATGRELGAVFLPRATTPGSEPAAGSEPNARQATGIRQWETAGSGSSAWTCCRAMTSCSSRPTPIFAAIEGPVNCIHSYAPKPTRWILNEV